MLVDQLRCPPAIFVWPLLRSEVVEVVGERDINGGDFKDDDSHCKQQRRDQGVGGPES